MNIHIVYGILLFLLPLTWSSNENAIIKNLGVISFFEKTWTHTINLNLKEYIENGLILQNATENLIKICGKMPDDTNCKYFQDNVEKNAAIAQREINEILEHKRTRRSVWGFFRAFFKQALVACGVIAVTTVIQSRDIEELRQEQAKDRELLRKAIDIQHLQNNLSLTLNSKIEELEHKARDKEQLNE